jgi:2',3'-cyclic-nucleotide 2'-phosphodiesterase (5'-nucleotidase family)
MIRTAFFVLAILASAATAIASGPFATTIKTANVNNLTVIHMNDAHPSIKVLTVEKCAEENCSDTPQNL